MTTNTAARVGAFFDRKAASFDAIYSGHKPRAGRIWDRLTRRNISDRLEFTKQALAPLAGKSILDVGCGSGRYGLEFAALGARRVVGIDVAEQMLVLARGLAQQPPAAGVCEFLNTDVLSYRPAERFDAVVAMGFFDYVDEPAKVLAHLRTLTTGVVVAAFPALRAVRVPARKLYLAARGCPVFFYTRKRVLDLCGAAGLECRQLVKRGPLLLLVATPQAAPPAGTR